MRNPGIPPVPRGLLACGIAAAVLYFLGDLFVASQWPEYSYRDQAVSELSALGAPTRSLWNLVMAPYLPLFTLFAWAVWRAARGRRALRVTGFALLGLVAVGVGWYFVPMHLRESEKSGTDTGHLVMSALQGGFSLTAIGFGAFALGRRFRIYSIATLVAVVAGGLVTSLYAPRVGANLPTPWLGILERISVHGYMLWLAVLAAALLSEQGSRYAGHGRSHVPA
jgi:hypothetical membrane protein